MPTNIGKLSFLHFSTINLAQPIPNTVCEIVQAKIKIAIAASEILIPKPLVKNSKTNAPKITTIETSNPTPRDKGDFFFNISPDLFLKFGANHIVNSTTAKLYNNDDQILVTYDEIFSDKVASSATSCVNLIAPATILSLITNSEEEV